MARIKTPPKSRKSFSFDKSMLKQIIKKKQKKIKQLIKKKQAANKKKAKKNQAADKKKAKKNQAAKNCLIYQKQEADKDNDPTLNP